VTDVDEVPSRAFVRGLRLCDAALPAKMNMLFFYYSLRRARARAFCIARPNLMLHQVDVARPCHYAALALAPGLCRSRRQSGRGRLRSSQLHALPLLQRPCSRRRWSHPCASWCRLAPLFSLTIASAGVTCVELPSCGWHLSFFGGGGAVKSKLRAYSHQEWNSPRIVSVAGALCLAAGCQLRCVQRGGSWVVGWEVGGGEVWGERGDVAGALYISALRV
jgi:hypothetical protein